MNLIFSFRQALNTSLKKIVFQTYQNILGFTQTPKIDL